MPCQTGDEPIFEETLKAICLAATSRLQACLAYSFRGEPRKHQVCNSYDQELKKEFPKQQIRSVKASQLEDVMDWTCARMGAAKANLSDSSGSWMQDVKAATQESTMVQARCEPV